MSLRISGGSVYDPANGINGDVRDIFITDGRIVATAPADAKTIDARGMVVMPGGVDIHSHVAGASVNLARRLLPEEHDADPAPRPDLLDGEPLARSHGRNLPRRSDSLSLAGLGYTTVFDAASPPDRTLSHAELRHAIGDAGFRLMGTITCSF